MGYRLSGKVIFLLHVSALALISAAFADIGGSAWVPLVLWLIGAWLQWMMSLPGAKRSLLGERSSYFARMVMKNGWEHWGHARRRDWDRYGRHSRLFLHVLCVASALFFFTDNGARWPATLLAASFSLGVEIGFLFFKTGDESEWRRFRRRTS